MNLDNGERKIRLEIHEFEEILRKANIIKQDEYVYTARIEPGELVITVVKE